MTSPTPVRPIVDRGRRSSGFTLVELLVVLALLGVLAAMVAPRFGGTVRSVEAEEAVQRLRSELSRYRVDAARHHRRVEVRFDPSGRPELVVDTFEAPRHPAWDFTPLDVAKTRSGLRRSSVVVDFAGTLHAEPPQLVFYPDGSSTSSVIRLEDARGRSFQIDVRPLDTVLVDPATSQS